MEYSRISENNYMKLVMAQYTNKLQNRYARIEDVEGLYRIEMWEDEDKIYRITSHTSDLDEAMKTIEKWLDV